MNSSKTAWLRVNRANPCPVCGKADACKVSPDGTAAMCLRIAQGAFKSDKGWHYHRLKHLEANTGKHRRPVDCKVATAPKTYPNAQAAIEAAARGMQGKAVAEWPYAAADGNELMRVVRFALADGGKKYRPIHPADGGWRIGDPPGRLSLFGLPLLNVSTTDTIYVCEGEKAAMAAREIGLTAITSAHGSSTAEKSDWWPVAGRNIVVLPDHDEPGEKYAQDVARLLMALNPPAMVKIVRLPGLPEKGDVVEFIEQRTDQPADAIRAEIETLVEQAVYVESTPAEVWPDPLPLPAGLPPVMPFDFALLPASLHGWIKDISERMQCPPDYCAATAMIVAGALIGRKVAIRPKRRDEWQVVPNLYGAMVGRASVMKSPAMNEVLKFTKKLEVQAKEEYQRALAEQQADAIIKDAKRKIAKKALSKAVEEGEDTGAFVADLAKGDDDTPIRRRYMVNDTTVEKLGVILAENPNGVMVYADELISLLRTMEREGHEADRGFYLQAWNGDLRHTHDRIGRGTLDIEAAIVSIVGSIQPGVIGDYLRSAMAGGSGDDGLIQRFQLTVWPDQSATWKNVDEYPDKSARDTAYAALNRLASLTPEKVMAESDDYAADALPYLRFDPDAQEIFNAWREEIETHFRSGIEHPAMDSHLSKYRSLIPSLALILHLLDGGIGAVSSVAVGKAIAWGGYLESHARRLYAGVTNAPAVAARLLAKRIQDGDVPMVFAARDVYRNGWTGLSRESTETAIDVLLSLNWLEERIEPTGGKSRIRYIVNPKIGTIPKGEPTKPTEAAIVSKVSGNSGESADFDAKGRYGLPDVPSLAGGGKGELWNQAEGVP